MLAGVVEQDAAHLGGGHGHEMAAAFERGALVDQADVGFVHQGRGLHRVLAALAAEIGAGQTVQFVVDQGQKLVDGFLLAASDFSEQAGDFAVIAQGAFIHRLSADYNARERPGTETGTVADVLHSSASGPRIREPWPRPQPSADMRSGFADNTICRGLL